VTTSSSFPTGHEVRPMNALFRPHDLIHAVVSLNSCPGFLLLIGRQSRSCFWCPWHDLFFFFFTLC